MVRDWADTHHSSSDDEQQVQWDGATRNGMEVSGSGPLRFITVRKSRVFTNLPKPFQQSLLIRLSLRPQSPQSPWPAGTQTSRNRFSQLLDPTTFRNRFPRQFTLLPDPMTFWNRLPRQFILLLDPTTMCLGYHQALPFRSRSPFLFFFLRRWIQESHTDNGKLHEKNSPRAVDLRGPQ